MNENRFSRLAAGCVTMCMLASAGCTASKPPAVDHSSTTQSLESLPRHQGPRKVVAIYDFESVAPDIVSPQAATDMFTTALIKSGAFAVAERSNQAVKREQELKKAVKPKARAPKVASADYIFVGKISEANLGQDQNKGKVSVGGMDLGANKNKDSIGIDVRIVDATSGLVLDSVNVRKEIAASGAGASGVGKLIGKFVNTKGLDPDVEASTSKKEGKDEALRACVEQAVLELVRRYAAN